MKKRTITYTLLIGVLFLSVGLLSIQAKPEKTHAFTENIKIGGVFPIVKRPDAGRDRRDAFLMAVATLNEQPADGDDAGGPRILPDGINFTAIVKDDDNSAAGGTFAASTLISEGVDVVIGSSGSSVSAAMAAELGPEKIVQISYASSSPSLSDRTLYPYFMRNTPSDADQGIAVADLVDAMNWTQGATISTDDSYGTGLITVFTGAFEHRGGTITTAQSFSPGATDVSAQVQAIKDSNPEFVVANLIDVDGATLFQKAAELFLTNGTANAVPWIITDGTSTTSTFSGNQAVEDAMQNFIGTTPLSFSTPELTAFNDSWFDPKWADPIYWSGLSGPIYSQVTGLAFNSYAPLAYDSVFLAAKGLRDAGTADGDALLAAMYDVTHDGAAGEIIFNDLGEVSGRFDYVQLVGTVYTPFGVWNSTGFGLTSGTLMLPGDETFVPENLVFPPFYIKPGETTTTTTEPGATTTTTTTTTTVVPTTTPEATPGFTLFMLLSTFAAVIVILRRSRK
jgi:ABC-type branched-subunit amino acid transport system substrate-binding protein